MPVATDRRPFVADAVFIPSDQVGHVDPDQCIKLMVDGDNNSADVFTENAWANDGEPFCRREHGTFTEVEGGEVELLPELWIVKIDERGHWYDPAILDACHRIYGVYVFDRRQHFHICSVEACYELHFLGSQYEESDEISGDEYLRGEIFDAINKGDAQSDQVTYWSKQEIDRMLQTVIKDGCLPPEREHGGYRLTGIQAVTPDEAIEEAREAHQASEL